MKRLMMVLGLLLVVGLLLPVSCAQAPPPAPSVVPTPTPRPAPMPPSAPPSMVKEGVYTGNGAGTLPSMDGERMIVRNGDIYLVVKDVVGARDEIARLAVRLGGYVVSSQISGEDEGMRGSISIRVPDEKFEQVMVELRDLAERVKSESTNSRDVTEEYIDLEARLRNAEATESQYLALLDKAEAVEDMLKIYDSLSRVRREIEQIKGQMNYLERTSSMSLITAQLRPVASDRALVPVGWSALETLKSAIRGAVTLGQWLVNIAIWLVILSPIWGTVVGLICWRRRRKRRSDSSAG